MRYFKVEHSRITFIGSFYDFIQERYRCESVGSIKYDLYARISYRKRLQLGGLITKCKVESPYVYVAIQQLRLVNTYYLFGGLKGDLEVSYLGV